MLLSPFFTEIVIFYSRKAFERALVLDPQNVAALCAISIMDSNLMTAEGVSSGVQVR